MPANTNPIFIASRKLAAVEIDNADGSNLLDLVDAGPQGTLIESISATTDDTSDVEVELYLSDGSETYQIGSGTVTAGAGTDGGTTVAIDLLSQANFAWLRDDLTLPLENGWKLQVGVYSAVTSGKAVHIVALAGDY